MYCRDEYSPPAIQAGSYCWLILDFATYVHSIFSIFSAAVSKCNSSLREKEKALAGVLSRIRRLTHRSSAFAFYGLRKRIS